jgi:hypothetical protein
MEISRSEAGFFHVAYAVKNSRGLSTGFHLLPKDSTQHTRDKTSYVRHELSFPEFRFWQHNVDPVPLPSTLFLFATGLGALGLLG